MDRSGLSKPRCHPERAQRVEGSFFPPRHGEAVTGVCLLSRQKRRGDPFSPSRAKSKTDSHGPCAHRPRNDGDGGRAPASGCRGRRPRRPVRRKQKNDKNMGRIREIVTNSPFVYTQMFLYVPGGDRPRPCGTGDLRWSAGGRLRGFPSVPTLKPLRHPACGRRGRRMTPPLLGEASQRATRLPPLQRRTGIRGERRNRKVDASLRARTGVCGGPKTPSSSGLRAKGTPDDTSPVRGGKPAGGRLPPLQRRTGSRGERRRHEGMPSYGLPSPIRGFAVAPTIGRRSVRLKRRALLGATGAGVFGHACGRQVAAPTTSNRVSR